MIVIYESDSKQFSDNESFRRWLTDTIFGLTYEQPENQ